MMVLYDDNRDEYEIDIFTWTLKSRKNFDAIIEQANKCGNMNIRQYVI